MDSSEASVSERDPLSQRFSVSVHPRLPIILSSDGYLVTVMQLPSVASYQGVMTGFMRDITRFALMKCCFLYEQKCMPLSAFFFPYIVNRSVTRIAMLTLSKKEGNKSEQRKGKRSDSSESKDWVVLTLLTIE